MIDARKGKVIAKIPGGLTPESLDITPNGASAYVTNFDAFLVSVIDTSSYVPVAAISLRGLMPFRVAITPDGRFAYVIAREIESIQSHIAVIDTAINQVV
ncbi:MAG: YncE family protein, partial [Rhodospirillales bacterium]|nr:YncE family protein [Rhodospirillales bacterium]